MTRSLVVERALVRAAVAVGRPLAPWLAVRLATAVTDSLGEEKPAAPALPDPVVALSPRLRQIGALLADGLSVDEISGALFLAPNTVKTHLRYLYAALGARNGNHAAALITRYGLGTPVPGPVRKVRR
ncbi:DNA-binding NarL/FixJ family response regulator [Streptacidiphilus sp. MAP12-33]|uniref:LuxR C-terminal-related transcriptional regulator n=1 Tax=Streptacidiphilus sp. MAP12-33 TaxID=3156266 RepID=UPI003515F5BE